MKVSGFSSIKSAGSVKKRGSTSAVGSFADLLGTSDTDGAASASAATSIASTSSLSNLLSLQEIQEDGQSKRKAIQQGNDMLDSLDRLRHSILTGSVPIHVLRNLNSQLSAKKQYITDQRLLDIIDDIELRASVELAKIETAIQNQQAGRTDRLDDSDI